MYLSLVNLPLLASLKEWSICGEFDCFLEVENGDSLEKDGLADKATKDKLALFWEVIALPVEKAFSCF